ncbi:hypothetical protein [Streptomyces sp. 4F14]|uniref:hypothetical protein n=1 Tax=Streptomyces sp. 4F14 TaxID=3394380 RepID=UPI003A8A77CF
MPNTPRPRRITLGGREAVALTVPEYERLIASRRQVGGQSARVRVLGEQVRRTERLLAELEALVGGPAPCHRAPDDDCLRCAVAGVLRRYRGQRA